MIVLIIMLLIIIFIFLYYDNTTKLLNQPLLVNKMRKKSKNLTQNLQICQNCAKTYQYYTVQFADK